MEQDNNLLIHKAIEKSKEALSSAVENFFNKHYETCQNRLYYAIFYIVSGLAYKDNFITSKHSQLMGWFNKKYVHEDKIFDNRLFSIYKETFSNRQLSDYDFMYTPKPEDIELMIQDVKGFVSVVEKYLMQNI